MSKFAVIETGGKQYQVSPGQKVKIEKLGRPVGESFEFDKVLFVAEKENVRIGTPYLDSAKVKAKVLREARTDKKIVFRYHSKTRYRKFKTHRQNFTEVEITEIK